MNVSSRPQLDWRLLLVGVAFAVTILVLLLTVIDWDKAHNDGRLSGVTTGISPANTVYPPQAR